MSVSLVEELVARSGERERAELSWEKARWAEAAWANGLLVTNHTSAGRVQHSPSSNLMNRVREVWAANLDQEIALLRDLVDQYPYVTLVGNSCLCGHRPLTRCIRQQLALVSSLVQ